MSKIALYRKYRPSKFNEVIGQNAIVKTLASSIVNNSRTHAYIFAGNKGSGKTTVAKIFSKAINCLNSNNGDACNECSNCKAIDEASTTDFVELDAASNNGVEEIRNIINLTNYLPNKLKYKVYIIDEAHMLTTNAWNALLKTIEEPPPYVVFIFATTEYHKIPATIISRCQRFDFLKLQVNDLITLINKICEKENIKIDSEAIPIIARMADGAARDALSIVDQVSNYSGNNVKCDDIYEIFGLTSTDLKIDFLNEILSKNSNKVINIYKTLFEKGINITIFISDLLDILMDKLIYIKTNDDSLLTIISKEQLNKINNFVNDSYLLSLINLLSEALSKIKNSSNPKFVFEYYILKALSIEDYSQINNEIKTQNLKTKNATPSLESSINNTEEQHLSKAVVLEDKWANIKQDVNKSEIQKPKKSTLVDTSKSKSNDLFKTKELSLTKELYDDVNELKHKNIEEIVANQPTTEFLFANNEKTKPLEYANFIEFEKTNQDKSKDKTYNKSTENINVKSKQENKKTFHDYDEDFKNKFFAIAANHDSKIKNELNIIFGSLKEIPSAFDYKQANIFLLAEKFLISSKNGAVLLFNNKSQSINFNNIANDIDFNKHFKDNFKCSKIILGIDKETAILYKDEFKKMNKKDIKDVKILIDNDDKKILLLDILNDSED